MRTLTPLLMAAQTLAICSVVSSAAAAQSALDAAPATWARRAGTYVQTLNAGPPPGPAAGPGPSWSENFDSYPNGAPVDPGGQASIGNLWESWSSGIGSSTVAGSAPAPPASSAPNCLSNNPGADTVANYTLQASQPTSGRWNFDAQVYHPQGYVGRHYWSMLNTYDFGGPYSWSIQTYFDGTQNLVDCDCNNMNDPAGPQVLVRDAWTEIRGEIDLDLDVVDVLYNGASLTGGAGYQWTTGVFGGSMGSLTIEGLDLYPDVPGFPTTTAMYYDDFDMYAVGGGLGTLDPQCTPLPHSGGHVVTITLTGTGAGGDVILATAENGPPGEVGCFITGPNSGPYVVPPGSNGLLCIGDPSWLYASAPLGQLFVFDAAGVSQAVVAGGPSILTTDGSYAPVPAVFAGESRAFQAWFNDVPASNFSESKIVLFN